MGKAILRYFIFIFSIALLISSILTGTLISNRNLSIAKQDMLHLVKLIEYSLDEKESMQKQIEDMNPFVFTDDSRITIIDKEGQVLADTYDSLIEENHLDRKEVKDALTKGSGYTIRQSSTTGYSFLYVAYYDGDHVVRLAMPYNGFTDQLYALAPTLLISTVISFLISFVLAKRFARKFSEPMNEICEELDHLDYNKSYKGKEYKYDEFNIISKTIENLSHRLRKTLDENRFQQTKIDEILKQMNEGFVLLDDEYKVLNINNKAISILGPVRIQSDFLKQITIDKLKEALNNPVSKQFIELKIDDLYYACYISRKNLGTTLLFVDITATKQNDKMRREFFSNVSHELKTPMTSIKGYSELLSQGLIADENKKEQMLNKIQNEANNMMNLINDILMLSRIEYMEDHKENVPIRLDHLVDEVLERYELQIELHSITVTKHLEEFIYYGNHSYMHTLISNLISNAIKYNKEHGYIDIIVEDGKNEVKIIIEDSGIGIPQSVQHRVFERFFRVDKARSRQSGGTGLGLAIVKHIVSSCNGVIKLNSIVDRGTKIEVVLPKQ